MLARAAVSAVLLSALGAFAQDGHEGHDHGDAPAAEPEAERGMSGMAGHEVGADQHHGGHVGDLWMTEKCTPVRCGDDRIVEGAIDHTHQVAMEDGCFPYDIYNFMKDENETVLLTCQACEPITCGHGEHDCVPRYCDGQDGQEGGHSSDPCEGGHHADDGLGFWAFLLISTLVTVFVTAGLNKLAQGACCGKSFNPPFTVIMFFFGYLCSMLASSDAESIEHLREAMEHSHYLGSLANVHQSVIAWKGAHAHVILFVLLPPLLFEDASGMDYYVFRKVLMSSILLAGPGVVINMTLIAATTMGLFGFANECVVEVDPHTNAHMVDGAKDNTEGTIIRPDGTSLPGQKVCDPGTYIGLNMPGNSWQTWDPVTCNATVLEDSATGACPGSEGFPCIECVDAFDLPNGDRFGGSYTSEQLPVSVHLLLGGMLAATDPVAVCAVLNSLGCPDKLNFMIAGESLLNDGTAVVAFLIMQGVAGGCDVTFLAVVGKFMWLAGGGVVWGLMMASFAYNFIKHLRDPNIEISMLLFCTLATFWLAENVLVVSGVLGTVVFGVQTARTSFLAMDEHTHHANHAFWGEVGYLCTSFIFILAGVKSYDKIASLMDNFAEDFEEQHEPTCYPFSCGVPDPDPESAYVPDPNMEYLCAEAECLTHHVCRWVGSEDHGRCLVQHESNDEDFQVGNQLFLNVLLWFVMTFIRAAALLVLAPILRNIGYGLTFKEGVVMVWGGLRGAVSLSLALLVDGNHLIGDRAREMIFLQTTGIVALTLIINGTTSGMVYKWLEVYPPNPFRPVLATQGLRNLQLEMDKYIEKLKGHWFHCNAENETLKSLMPNFSEAHMYDGDLVDVIATDMHTTWTSKVCSGATISPQRLTLQMGEAIRSGTKAGLNIMRLGYDKKAGADSGETRDPNSYAEIVIVKGPAYQSFETDVVKNDRNPTWSEGAEKRFFLPPGDDPVTLYLHMFDNDLGEIDDYLGQATADLTALVASKNSDTLDLPLETGEAVNEVKKREYDGTFPVEVCGSLKVSVKCDDQEIVVTLVSAAGIGGEGVKKASIELGEEGGAEVAHDHAHGHGHGGGHITMLKNVKRWIDECKEDVEPSYAMYDVMLSTMRAHFLHELENKMLSVSGFSKLNAAIGIALDINNDQMEGSIADKMAEASSETSTSASVTTWQRLKPEEWSSPVDACVNSILDFCDTGEAFVKHPSAFFQHRLLCAEMLLTLIDQLKQLGDVDMAGLGPDFGPNLIAANTRAKVKLASMQVGLNGFRSVWTLRSHFHTCVATAGCGTEHVPGGSHSRRI